MKASIAFRRAADLVLISPVSSCGALGIVTDTQSYRTLHYEFRVLFSPDPNPQSGVSWAELWWDEPGNVEAQNERCLALLLMAEVIESAETEDGEEMKQRGVLKGNGREWVGVVTEDGLFSDESGDMFAVKANLRFLTKILGFTFEPEEAPITITKKQFDKAYYSFKSHSEYGHDSLWDELVKEASDSELSWGNPRSEDAQNERAHRERSLAPLLMTDVVSEE